MGRPLASNSVAALVSANLLAGCSTIPEPPAAWSALCVGMKQDEVRATLGEPDRSYDLAASTMPEHTPEGEWCRTLQLVQAERASSLWLYEANQHQTFTVAFNEIGEVMSAGRSERN